MMWDEWYDFEHHEEQFEDDSHVNFDFLSVLTKPKDYYKILEVDYDASDEDIRSNYIRLALKWHPDKQKGEEAATSKFQEINEAYQVLSDPVKRLEYNKEGMFYSYDSNIAVTSQNPFVKNPLYALGHPELNFFFWEKCRIILVATRALS